MVLKPTKTVFINSKKACILVFVEVAGSLNDFESIGVLSVLS